MISLLIEMIRSQIEDPWKHALEELFISFGSAGSFVRIAGKVLFQGELCGVEGSSMWVRPRSFSPGKGFIPSGGDMWEISVQDLATRDLHCQQGDFVSFFGSLVESCPNRFDMSRDHSGRYLRCTCFPAPSAGGLRPWRQLGSSNSFNTFPSKSMLIAILARCRTGLINL